MIVWISIDWFGAGPLFHRNYLWREMIVWISIEGPSISFGTAIISGKIWLQHTSQLMITELSFPIATELHFESHCHSLLRFKVASLAPSISRSILITVISWRDFEVSFVPSASLQIFFIQGIRVIVHFYSCRSCCNTNSIVTSRGWWLATVIGIFFLIRNLSIPIRNDWFSSMGVSPVWMVLYSYFKVLIFMIMEITWPAR